MKVSKILYFSDRSKDALYAEKSFMGKLSFIVTGAIQRSNADRLSHGQRFKKAVIKKINWGKKSDTTLLEYVSPADVCSPNHPSIVFTGATLFEDKFYVPTCTEILILSYPEFEIERVISYPFFHDIHHVQVFSDYIGVVSTGLDMIIFLDKKSYEPIYFKNVLNKDPWERFSQNTDYRKINSTKPHESHPNCLFEIDGEVWVTRFEQKDAIALNNSDHRINIGVERCHDGHVDGDFVYFTSVDGKIVVANKYTYKIEHIYSLNEIEGHNQPLGWCRGLSIIGNSAFVGFSRIRGTEIKENIKWARNFVVHKRDLKNLNNRIVQYDLKKRTKIDEYVFNDINMVYSIINEK